MSPFEIASITKKESYYINGSLINFILRWRHPYFAIVSPSLFLEIKKSNIPKYIGFYEVRTISRKRTKKLFSKTLRDLENVGKVSRRVCLSYLLQRVQGAQNQGQNHYVYTFQTYACLDTKKAPPQRCLRLPSSL